MDFADNSSNTSSQESPDAHLWGYLQPCNARLSRIDLWKIHPRYTLGRNSDTNQIVLPGLKISSSHCIIAWDGLNSSQGGIFVIDLSTNGTFINGGKIGRNKTRILNDGNEIAFGSSQPQLHDHGREDYRFIYRHVAGAAPSTGLYAVYDVGNEIGKGSFATVRKAVHRETGIVYAVKTIIPSKAVCGRTGREKTDITAREIHVMKQLDHRNVCKLVETYFQKDGSVNLVLELVDGGNLLKFLHRAQAGIEELFAKDITYQICDAMSYIHSKGITHRDLKLENVLLTAENPPLVKVADFGLAKVVDNLTMLRTMCGTPNYLAPEVLAYRPTGYSNTVDSWSVGVIVFSILTNREPFRPRRDHELLRAHIYSRRVEWSILEQTKPALSQEAKYFIGWLLQTNPRRRMSLTSALEHQWLREHIPFYARDQGPAASSVCHSEHTPSTSGSASESRPSARGTGSQKQTLQKLPVKTSGSAAKHKTNVDAPVDDQTSRRPRRSARLARGGKAVHPC